MIQSKQRNSSWRKRYLLGSDKLKEKTIGKPVLVETTLQEEFLDQLPDVRNVQHVEGPTIRVYSAAAVHTDKYMKELPPLSFQLEAEDQGTPRPPSEVPTASSIYTRPSPEFPYEFDPAAQVAPLFAGKSKPLNRVVNEDARKYAGHGSDTDATLRPTFTDRARQAGMGSLGIDTGLRAPWQGASGQTNQLTPIAATPATTSKSGSISPVEDSRKANYFPYHPSDEYPTPESAGQRLKETTPSRNTSTTLPPYIRETPPPVSRFSWTTHATETEPPKTVGPATPETQNSQESWNNASPPPYYQRNHQNQQSPTPAGRRRSNPQANRHKPTAASSRNPPEPTASPSPKIQPMTQSPQQQVATATSSPKTDVEITTTPPSPIMSRSRPLAKPKPKSPPAATATLPANAPTDKPMRIKRKPAPTSVDSTTHPRSPISPPSSRPGSKHKSLPLTPSTLSSIDHITLLQSQLSTLSLRKHNLAKVIASHTALFSAADGAHNPMVVDLAARRATKATVAVLERDLAEVTREEHDIGLRLMRAQRRRDQEAPSALWVRRVTGVSDDL